MPYNVLKPLAEFSVNKTLEMAEGIGETGLAVIHGSKYPELRARCALELEKLGNDMLLVANPEELLKPAHGPHKILVKLRENISPNTALYLPFVKIPFIPLLAYLGVDFFGADSGNFYAQLGQINYSHRIYDLKDYELYRFNKEELRNYNQNTLDFVLREVRENIRNKPYETGGRKVLLLHGNHDCPEDPDRDYGEYLDEYTTLY